MNTLHISDPIRRRDRKNASNYPPSDIEKPSRIADRLAALGALALALCLSGCFAVSIATPYGSLTRSAAGKTSVELDLRGFAK